MSEELLVRHCSPTLAGLKTGSLFTCRYASEKDVTHSLRRLNRLLVSRGLRVLPLRYRQGRVLIYLYRPEKLRHDLADEAAGALLRSRGYPSDHPARCIVALVKRLQTSACFPHEIGLFLGYPPEDVQGFIDNGAGDCKCAGCWKVYGDEEKAHRLFACYKKCTAIYCARWSDGHPFERLVVAG